MAFTLKDLLPVGQQLTTVQQHESVGYALDLLFKQGFGQLPVVEADGLFSGLVVTFESILLAAQALRVSPDGLIVRDVVQRAEGYAADSDLLRMLDDLHRDNFALIVDGSHLSGIVTTADATIFFQSYAQDLMQIESIESQLREVVGSFYADEPEALRSAIARTTGRGAETRQNLSKALLAYLNGIDQPPIGGLNEQALLIAEQRMGLPRPPTELSRTSFHDLIELLLQHQNAKRLPESVSKPQLRSLLQRIRDSRNRLAHFRGDLSAEERRVIRFANDWLDRNLPSLLEPLGSTEIIRSAPLSMQQSAVEDFKTAISNPVDDRNEAPVGSYAKLAQLLNGQSNDVSTMILSFKEIATLLGKDLPRSAYDYRAWWANDPTKPQSAAWLDEGWKTKAISMADQRLTLERTNDRAEAYIRFFAELMNVLARDAGRMAWRGGSPTGSSWHVLASLDAQIADGATLIASFTRGKKLRIEVYLDYGVMSRNKACFDWFFAREKQLEQALGEPLAWERLDAKRASRIALYTQVPIVSQSDNHPLVEWAAKRSVEMYDVFWQLFKEQAF